MDERWHEIHGTSRGIPTSGLRHETPLTPNPECPTHCRRHETEAHLCCPKGHGASYLLVAHEFLWTAGHYFYSIEPLDGAPAKGNQCPLCGEKLERK